MRMPRGLTVYPDQCQNEISYKNSVDSCDYIKYIDLLLCSYQILYTRWAVAWYFVNIVSQIAIDWVEWNVIQFQLYAIKALLAISLPYDSTRYEMLIYPGTFTMPHLRSSTDHRCINFFYRCANGELLSDPSNLLYAVSKSSAFASKMSSVKCHSSIQQCGYYFFTRKDYVWLLPLQKESFLSA